MFQDRGKVNIHIAWSAISAYMVNMTAESVNLPSSIKVTSASNHLTCIKMERKGEPHLLNDAGPIRTQWNKENFHLTGNAARNTPSELQEMRMEWRNTV